MTFPPLAQMFIGYSGYANNDKNTIANALIRFKRINSARHHEETWA